ncbi:hypothetical protein DRP53_10165 [candidate division WOR-3 bacterium]|uniref:MEMO1 family protein DRP53_10165 n=1 Tax=candidate division WOR-3 bacterium TaxID=2052148 RepID=A0A660SDH1_UNCW3|nr:MAG: hypothetical protein DRP53_10165 [candidate division WOR-3 bacterium]
MRWILILSLLLGCSRGENRGPNVAGAFYPGEKATLEKMLKELFTGIPTKHISGRPILLIEPHAGYIYSGKVAAFGFKLLEPRSYDLVLIFGPSHHHYFYGASIDTLSGHQTPLGLVPYDRGVIRALLKAGLSHHPQAHDREHSTEVELPFLQYRLGKFRAVEIVIGDYDLDYLKGLAKKIYEVVKHRNLLIVASSDLSHYHRYREAVRIDQKTIEHIGRFDIGGLYQDLREGRCEACGGGPILAGLYLARMLGANTVKPLFYANSGDVTGDSSHVVGYLAAVAYKRKEQMVGINLGLSQKEKQVLRQLAMSAIRAVVRGEKFTMPPISERLKRNNGAFVTIKKDGQLRGCIGYLLGVKPLYQTVIEVAQSAAMRDPRFPPLTPEELDEIEIEISVLTEPVPVKDIGEIKIGRDGIIIRRGPNQGLLLPQVAIENDWDLYEFLAHTCLKAGLPTDAWQKEGTQIYRFSAEVF